MLSLTLLLTLMAWPGGAHAQAACDASAVDQYVECIPTSGGDEDAAGSGGKPRQTPLPPVRGHAGAERGRLGRLRSSRPSRPTPASARRRRSWPRRSGVNGEARVGKEQLVLADPQADVSAGDTLSAAVTAVQGGDAARLIGLLVVLFLVSVGDAQRRGRPPEAPHHGLSQTSDGPPERAVIEAEKEGFEPSREACAPLTP